MTTLWLHLRTSPLRWLLIPLIALTFMILLLRSHHWIGIWPETGAAAQVPAFFLSVIAAGSLAWVSGATSRHRLEEQLAAASASAVKINSYRFGSSLIVLMVPYLMGHVVAFALTARTFPPGMFYWVGYLLQGSIAILLASAWGWLLGKVLNPAYGALTAFLSWLIVLMLVGRTSGLTTVSGPVWRQVDGLVVAVRAVIAVAFCIVILWYPVKTSSRKARLLGTGASAVCVISVAIVVGTTHAVVDRRPSDNLVCVDGKITMCLWPESSKYIPMVRAFNARVEALPAQLLLPPRLNQYGVDRIRVTYQGRTHYQIAGGFDITEGSKWGLALGVSDGIIEATLKPCNLRAMTQAQDSSAETIRRWIELFLANGSSPDYKASGVPRQIQDAWTTADKVRALSTQDQFSWVDRQLTQMRARYCA